MKSRIEEAEGGKEGGGRTDEIANPGRGKKSTRGKVQISEGRINTPATGGEKKRRTKKKI